MRAECDYAEEYVKGVLGIDGDLALYEECEEKEKGGEEQNSGGMKTSQTAQIGEPLRRLRELICGRKSPDMPVPNYESGTAAMMGAGEETEEEESREASPFLLQQALNVLAFESLRRATTGGEALLRFRHLSVIALIDEAERRERNAGCHCLRPTVILYGAEGDVLWMGRVPTEEQEPRLPSARALFYVVHAELGVEAIQIVLAREQGAERPLSEGEEEGLRNLRRLLYRYGTNLDSVYVPVSDGHLHYPRFSKEYAQELDCLEMSEALRQREEMKDITAIPDCPYLTEYAARFWKKRVKAARLSSYGLFVFWKTQSERVSFEIASPEGSAERGEDAWKIKPAARLGNPDDVVMRFRKTIDHAELQILALGENGELLPDAMQPRLFWGHEMKKRLKTFSLNPSEIKFEQAQMLWKLIDAGARALLFLAKEEVVYGAETTQQRIMEFARGMYYDLKLLGMTVLDVILIPTRFVSLSTDWLFSACALGKSLIHHDPYFQFENYITEHLI